MQDGRLEPIVKEIRKPPETVEASFGPTAYYDFQKSDIAYETTEDLNTLQCVCLHPVAMAFIEAAGGYVAAPSANRSGRPSPTSAKYVEEDMQGRIEMIIDGGDVEIGLNPLLWI